MHKLNGPIKYDHLGFVCYLYDHIPELNLFTQTIKIRKKI